MKQDQEQDQEHEERRASRRPEMTPRTGVLAILAVLTLGVAALSVHVSYGILVPTFGDWAVPTVGALDALWVVMQVTEILAGNNRRRAARVRYAGLGLTAILAALPAVHLAMTGAAGQRLDLAMIIAPVAIVATKGAWWWALPSLGRATSATTRQAIAAKRQQVADQLETMEAEAAHRIELMRVASDLQQQVTEAETRFRAAALRSQQTMIEKLHRQAERTAETIADRPLPALVGEIELPTLETLAGWEPTAPALPVTPAVTAVTQVNALPGPESVTPRPESVTPLTLPELAAVTGVTVPEPNVPMTDSQLDLLLRHLRYSTDPVTSYRRAAMLMRDRGFRASEERVRAMWRVMVAQEAASGRPADDGSDTEQAGEEADASA
ncbi:hypothetical protein [Streptomyces subrutilus]|uniref:hypothetical protein n=1 Tax=Streptomyces subrutilus TaxID=36818 RepID=UPI0033E87306